MLFFHIPDYGNVKDILIIRAGCLPYFL